MTGGSSSRPARGHTPVMLAEVLDMPAPEDGDAAPAA